MSYRKAKIVENDFETVNIDNERNAERERNINRDNYERPYKNKQYEINNKPEKNEKTVGHRVFTIIGIVLCVILIPIIIINCTLIIKQFTNKDSVPSLGGIFPMIVLTDSMKGTFDSGSLIVCKSEEAEDIKEGDVICFYDPQGNGTTTVTHRVVEIKTDENGKLSFITKGDNNNTEDQAAVPAENLLGVYKFHIAGLGSLALFMQTTPGLIIFVALPVLLLVGYDIIRRRLYEKKKNADTDELIAELEELRAVKDEAAKRKNKVSKQDERSIKAEEKATERQNKVPVRSDRNIKAENEATERKSRVPNQNERSIKAEEKATERQNGVPVRRERKTNTENEATGKKNKITKIENF